MIPFLACMALVASIYHLPPRVLPSIQAIEGGRPGTISNDADGSQDLGVMQINTRWIGPLVAYTREPASQVRARLINAPCYNIAAAGAILKTYLAEDRGDLMRAIGDYHSHTRQLNLSYQSQVIQAAEALFVRVHHHD
ncbi:lytic transglycosylase domain-containing protein [Acidisoma sp.]|uniref:lytic transglycosylase domain-containing protein n=1 Tax=Acidisoma sp. TaxID=1872115 RepID=UPI003AFFFC26